MNKVFFYTETAFHHEGDEGYLKRLIDASKRAGADGVKFQVLTEPANFLSTKHSGFNSLSGYCLSFDTWQSIIDYTKQQGMKVVFMPLDLRSMDMVSSKNIDYIDIHPVSFYDKPLRNLIKNAKVPVILGVGGRSLEEIKEADGWFGSQLHILMVGFQAFPSDLKDVKLQRIKKLAALYPDKAIGYADHSGYAHEHAITSNAYARLLGATVFEKHIAIEEGKERVDYASAISEEKIKRIIEEIQYLDNYVLQPQDDEELFRFSPPELKYRERQKKVVLKESRRAGHLLTPEDLTTKMIDREGGFYKPEQVVGKLLSCDMEADDLLEEKFLQS